MVCTSCRACLGCAGVHLLIEENVHTLIVLVFATKLPYYDVEQHDGGIIWCEFLKALLYAAAFAGVGRMKLSDCTVIQIN
jgi:hypothetical protein